MVDFTKLNLENAAIKARLLAHGLVKWYRRYSRRTRVEIDFETRSYADLTRVGAWAYSEDPSTQVIVMRYGIDAEPVQGWWPGEPMPDDLKAAILSGATVEAHNISFEYSIWTNIMVPQHGWIGVEHDRWRDNMAMASYMAMPAALDKLANALGFQGKDPEGTRLITKYCKLHLKTATLDIPWEDLNRFWDYCGRDVQIEQSVGDYLGDLPDPELDNFLLDLKINTRGIYLDLEGIENASAIVDIRSEELVTAFQTLTTCPKFPKGLKPTQIDKVKDWLLDNGLELETMKKAELEELLEDDGELGQGPARTAIELRLQINKASTKKLDAMARQRGKDGRARFQSRFHGAQTGRDTGSGFQPLNLNRGFEVKKWKDADGNKHEWPTVDSLVKDISHRNPALLDAIYGDAMVAIAKASRHWIQAEKGNRIIAGDFVSIEAVVLACLAGEEWKVEAFRQGKKIYELMADKIYRLPEGTVTKETHPKERQDGKTGELAFGYQGALNAWLNFDKSGRHTDERIIEICKAWRGEHPMTTGMWRGMETCAIDAVLNPGETYWFRSIGFQTVPFDDGRPNEWLSMILPNGKRIWYYKPQIKMGMPSWHKPKEKEACATGECDCTPRPQLWYWTVKTGQWKMVSTYGGKLTENAVQATSREILMPAVHRVENAGYPVILKVYDEVVSEPKLGFGSAKEFEDLMKVREPWFADWPVSVDVWEGDRYKK